MLLPILIIAGVTLVVGGDKLVHKTKHVGTKIVHVFRAGIGR